jgi:hypothetical protein
MSRDGKYSTEALMEVFGTPNPSPDTVTRWRWSWKHHRGRVKIANFGSAIRIMRESGVDPLFYQMGADVKDTTDDWPEDYYIIFYKEEHEVFFKLHAGIA